MSKLVLGTVQLGMAYGVNNKTGQPDQADAFAILDRAFEAGITMFDTAAAYGNSEEVVGAWILERSFQEKVSIVSKMKPAKGELRPEDEIRASMKRLHLKKLSGYMLHAVADMSSDEIVSSLKGLKAQGLAERVGASIYNPKEAHEAVAKEFDCIQIPYNVFDRRLDVSGFFDETKNAGMTVFARSPFLQGLLLMAPDEIPTHLLPAKQYVEMFRVIATSHHVSVLQAALAYVDAHSGIDHIVFGAETSGQLNEILEEYSKKAPTGLIEELRDAFDNVDSTIIDPSQWKKP